MKTFTYLSIALLVFALTGGISLAGKGAHDEELDPLEIDGLAEPILGLLYSGEGLEFQVRSTGCTEKAHFVVQRLSPESQITSQLLLIRVVPDYCDAYVPFGTRFSYSFEELGLEENEPFTLLNPLSSYLVRY
ncbi:MAG: hypothetical protein ABFS39_05445 [Pseudomonadota bacterium]